MPKEKSKPKKTAPSKEDLAKIAIDLAGDLGWEHLRFQDIADEAGISLAEISEHFDDKICILCAYGKYIDRRTLEETGDLGTDTPARERLFDILMTRFDIINEQREGVLSVLNSFKTDPKQALISLPYLGRSMTWMLEAAGLDTSGIKGAIRVVGLKMIYLKALKDWMNDDGDDMPKTMASLDKSLGKAEGLVERFGF